jgi:hypothetical protein
VSKEGESKQGTAYEKIVIAAREARRLNEMRIRGGVGAGDAKVTIEALGRTERGEVEWRIATPSEELDERAEERKRTEDFSFGD